MTLNGAIMQLVEMRENSMMPVAFKPYFDKVIETISECVEPSEIAQWIPCSERLPDNPENDDYYLVTIQCEHYDGWDDYVTGFAEWTKHGWDELSCYIGQIKVVAWMPLPEPWRGGEHENRGSSQKAD